MCVRVFVVFFFFNDDMILSVTKQSYTLCSTLVDKYLCRSPTNIIYLNLNFPLEGNYSRSG